MRTIALTSASERVQQYASDVARQLGARLIVVDSVMSLPAEGVDLLMWHRAGEDSAQLTDLQRSFPRMVRLEDETGGGRGAPAKAADAPILTMPPDPEDGALVLSYSSWAKKHGIDPYFWLQ